MKDFKIDFENGRKKLKLEAGSIETPEEWVFIKNILATVDIKTGDTEIDASHETAKEQKMKSLEEGYKHITKMETIEPSYPNGNRENVSSMAFALQKAEEKKKQQSQAQQAISFQNSPSTVRLHNNIKHYQCYSICPKCSAKNKSFIIPETKTIACKTLTCQEKMEVRTATEEGFPYEDVYGNVFIGGTFVRVAKSHKTNPYTAV